MRRVEPQPLRPRRRPATISTLITTLRANHGSCASHGARAAAPPRPSRRYSASEPVAAGVAPARARVSDAAARASRRPRRSVVDEHRPAAARPARPSRACRPAPARSGARRRRTAARSPRRRRRAPGRGQLAHVAHRGRRRPRRARFAVKAAKSASPRAASAAISCGPRSLPACGSIATTDARGAPRQHDRRAPAERADLDHRPRRAASARRAAPEPRRLRRGQPALDLESRPRQPPADGARGTSRPIAEHRASPAVACSAEDDRREGQQRLDAQAARAAAISATATTAEHRQERHALRARACTGHAR